MAISDTITSIEDNLRADYEGLENIYGEITGINKNILNIRTILDNVYNDLPKVTGEGTEVTLTPTRKGRLAIIPKGNSTQESTNGYNLLEPSFESTSSNNVTITNNNNGTYTLNGTATADATFVFKRNWSLENNAQYRVSGCPSGGSDDKYFIYSTGASIMADDTGEGTTMTTGTSAITLAFRVKSGTNVSGLILKPMVTLGTTQKTFEPYTNGPAPNPSYPFPIKSVTGNNNVVVHTKNLVNFKNVSLPSSNAADVLLDFGKDITFDNLSVSFFFENAKYTNSNNAAILDFKKNDNTHQYRLATAYGMNIDTLMNGQYSKSETNITFRYLQVMLGSSYSGFIQGKASVLVEESSTPSTSFIPYGNQTLPLNLGTIELNKIGNYQDYIYKTSGKNWFSSVMELGSINNNTGNTETNNDCIRTKDFMLVQPNTQYTISNNKNYANYVYEYDESYSLINKYTGGSYYGTYSFTTLALTKYIKVRTIAGSVQNDLTTKFMLNEGSTALPYEPYGSGKWYKKEEIKKKIFNGSEGWVDYIPANRIYSIASISDYAPNTESLGLFDKYSLWNGSAMQIPDNHFKFITNQKQLIIRDTRFESLTQFTLNMTTNNLIGYYPLENPTDIEITDTQLIEQLNEIEKMKSYNGTTIITSTNEGTCDIIIRASALKGE